MQKPTGKRNQHTDGDASGDGHRIAWIRAIQKALGKRKPASGWPSGPRQQPKPEKSGK